MSKVSEQQLSLYEQQINAAVAIREAVKADRAKEAQVAEQTAMHKQAFRVAFDILAQNWPPENTVDYWQPVAERFTKAFNEHSENPLAKKLLLAVYEYMNDTARKENGVTE